MAFSALECMISITNVSLNYKMYCIYRFSNPSQILSLGISKIFLKFILYYKIHSYRKKKKDCIASRRVLRA